MYETNYKENHGRSEPIKNFMTFLKSGDDGQKVHSQMMSLFFFDFLTPCITNRIWFHFDSLTLLFLFDVFLEARAESPVGFLVNLKARKGSFKIIYEPFYVFVFQKL